MSVIEFHNVSKGFRRHSGRALLRTHVSRWFQGGGDSAPFWALRNVSFSLDHGEGLAVIGSNGAGKSTLLSLVAGLAPCDEGHVTVDGRIAALFELGSGFHADLTGVENIRLNASLLGLSRARVRELFDQIVDFSGIGDFVEEPIRTYSSGMLMRLAFSVAIHLDPEVLLVDEVLSVGDGAFQQKCFDKILEFRKAGKTLLCVSHAVGMVQHFCDRALWLDHGELVMDGKIDQVFDAYSGRTVTA
jgi:ABC-type polysaccharide/polyol phosphate transport system ATPase subunit